MSGLQFTHYSRLLSLIRRNLNVQLGHWTFKYEQNTFEINGVSRPPPWGNPRCVAISSTP